MATGVMVRLAVQMEHGRVPLPALIGMLVDVAVIAGEVAPAVNLEDELQEPHGTGGDVPLS
ncbi:hypothetical protein, partial [Streptomyces sp. NPDC058614]|uniref:hypothetical protein n=1 Tax=Streptomyces sp. NPDC058614 TaxID=3346557 RepID=UPI0036605883